MARKGSCSVCGKTVAINAKSLPAPICQACRRAAQAARKYSPEQRRTHTARIRAAHADCDGSCGNSRHVRCAGACGATIWIGSKSSASPMCRKCRSSQPSKNLKTCQRCGREFVANTYVKFYCSRKCYFPGANYASQHERQYVKTLRRRAIKKAAYVEDVVPSVVFDRDGWMCQLCHEPVDPDAPKRDRMSASVDHIIPLSQGGLHCYSNVQLAHLSCNSRKGARWQGQLVLI